MWSLEVLVAMNSGEVAQRRLTGDHWKWDDAAQRWTADSQDAEMAISRQIDGIKQEPGVVSVTKLGDPAT